MANLTTTLIADVLEELYLSENQIEDTILRDNPTMALLPRSTEGGGQYRHVQNKYVRPQGRSATFATASSNMTGSKRVGFDVTWVANYQLAGIDGNVIDQARGNKVIIIDHVEAEMDGAIDNMRDDLAMGQFRNLGGARAQVGSTSTTTLTLKKIEDIAHFEVGMVIDSDDTDGTSGGSDDGDPRTILTVDRDLGTITTAANWTGSGNYSNDDYLFADGDFGAKTAGFDSWVPSSAPTSTAFFGVDRSVDKTRLGGVRYTGTGMPIEQAIINGCANIKRWKKSKPTNLAVLNPVKFAALEVSLENRKRITEVQGSGSAAHIGFTAILIATPSGDVPVISDPNCQTNVCWLLNKESWMHETCGDMVRLLDEDGLPFLRQASSDGYELRIKSLGNMYCKDPGSNGRVSLS